MERIAPGILIATLMLGPVGCGDPAQPFELGACCEEPSGHEESNPPPPSSAHIFLAEADGTGTTMLVRGDWPSWSPDGRRVAFHRDSAIHVIDIDGSNELRLIDDGTFPAWSPDGSRIAFTSRAGIAVARADGSRIELLVPHHFRDDTYADWDMGVGKPAWSPDSDRIAFEHLGDGDIQPAQIFVAGADGSDPFRPTRSPDGRRYAESDPAWSPDGRWLVFWSFGYGIATVGAAGGQPTTVYKNFPVVAYGAKPVWSPAGTIAFTANATAPAGHRGIWIVGAGGDGPDVLIPGAYHPAWSPDGNRIAFARAFAQHRGGSP